VQVVAKPLHYAQFSLQLKQEPPDKKVPLKQPVQTVGSLAAQVLHYPLHLLHLEDAVKANPSEHISQVLTVRQLVHPVWQL
jgi:hypothetical protein